MVSVLHARQTFNQVSNCIGNLQPWSVNNVDSPQSVLLKADTGADVNLMNRKNINQLFGEAKEVLKPTPIKMKNYENTAVKVLGMFLCFSQVERQGLQTIILHDRLWQIP